MITSLVRLIALAALSAPAVAAMACESLRLIDGGVVVAVPDGDTLILADGVMVRLTGIQAPRLPKGREEFSAWPQAEEARAALEKLVLNRSVRLGYGGAETDRYGRSLAHVFVEEERGRVWAQHWMVGQGLARVYSFPDNRACLDLLFAAEGRARRDQLGIWSDPHYSIRSADIPADLLVRIGRYELVEGRILQAEKRGGRIYLNFGLLWKDDLTATIEVAAQRLFADAGFDPLALVDAFVRIRGWVDERDGPRIEITHPEQIEVLATR